MQHSIEVDTCLTCGSTNVYYNSGKFICNTCGQHSETIASSLITTSRFIWLLRMLLVLCVGLYSFPVLGQLLEPNELTDTSRRSYVAEYRFKTDTVKVKRVNNNTIFMDESGVLYRAYPIETNSIPEGFYPENYYFDSTAGIFIRRFKNIPVFGIDSIKPGIKIFYRPFPVGAFYYDSGSGLYKLKPEPFNSGIYTEDKDTHIKKSN